MSQNLKKELKAKAKEIKSKGCPGYINLATASLEALQEYLSRWEDWEPNDKVEDDEESSNAEPSNFVAVQNAKTLSELGSAIADLAGTGDWADWGMNLWTKNGECRIYMKDCSYSNPKDRGYYLIKADGSYESYLSQSNCKFPALPKLPIVANDLEKVNISPEQKAIRKLNAQFGPDGWDQRDLDDELEREEYQ